MCGVRMTYYEKLVLVKNLHAKHYTKIIYHVYFVFKLYYNQHSINVKNFLSALLMVSEEKISVYFLVRVYYEYQNMYVFIPEQFNVRKLHKGDFNIFAETYFTKGIRFFSNQGRWVFFENYFGHSNSQQIHWLHILYLYSEVSHADLPITESSNALVFKENTHLILEIIHQVQYGSVIKALFHNISLKDILSVTENNNTDFSTDIIKPLDLSITFVTKNQSLLSRKNNGRSKNMLPCDICGKEFDRPSLLKRHIRTHTGERPHVCEICGKGFSTSSSLNTHKRIHSGERPHQCRICGKRFTASSNLYYHRLTHSAEKPHKCDICGKSFPTPGNLRSHKYSHEGLSPYKCNLCNRMFSKHINLKNHVNLHKIK